MILGVLESPQLCSSAWYQWQGVTMRLKISGMTYLGVYVRLVRSSPRRKLATGVVYESARVKGRLRGLCGVLNKV